MFMHCVMVLCTSKINFSRYLRLFSLFQKVGKNRKTILSFVMSADLIYDEEGLDITNKRVKI